MITAIPLVNPVITGWGMNLIALPSFAKPMMTSSTPAISVATVSPSTPYFCDDAVDDDHERARRAADLHARPTER